jgi:hypothetical protein
VGLVGTKKPINSVIQMYVSVYLFAVLIGTYISSYFQISLTSMLSFSVADGWCNAVTQGVGAHCFGDFYYTLTFLEQSNPWSTAANPYPPIALLIFKPFAVLMQIFPASQFALFCYLGFLIASILTIPVHLILSKKMGISYSMLVGMLILSTTPTIVALDRGNLVVLCMPMLYFFLHYEREGNAKRSFIFWVTLVLIKPQFALLSLIFLRGSNAKGAFKKVALGFSLFCASFLTYPTGITENFKAYLKQLVSYQDYGSLGNIFPVNISLGSALSLVDGFIKTMFAGATQFIGVTLLIVTVIIVYRSPARLSKSIVLPILLLPIILPQTSWHYYLIVLVPFFIFAITNTSDSKIGIDIVNQNTLDNRMRNFSQIGLSAWAVLLFVPWTIPWNVFAPSNTNFGSSTISMHWVLVIWSLPIFFIGSLIYTEFSNGKPHRSNKSS